MDLSGTYGPHETELDAEQAAEDMDREEQRQEDRYFDIMTGGDE